MHMSASIYLGRLQGRWPVFLEREKGSCGKYDQSVVRAFERGLGAILSNALDSVHRCVRRREIRKGRRVPSVSEGSRFRRGWVMNFVALRMLTGDRAKY